MCPLACSGSRCRGHQSACSDIHTYEKLSMLGKNSRKNVSLFIASKLGWATRRAIMRNITYSVVQLECKLKRSVADELWYTHFNFNFNFN